MSEEILYTSAPQGLKQGSRGFCTVVSTKGMAKNLAERLESLSGYRHVFSGHDSRAKLNPVNFSHLIIKVGGRPYHVLSRVCDAGTDYTGRSNKLAHHVSLQPKEIADAPGGPAWVMSHANFCETSWDGTTRVLPVGRPPRNDDFPPEICQTWARVTGDAGWAGVLAESALVKRPRPVSLIFKPGTDTLRLALEALSLLPPEKRWKVTFSTYFTKLPAGVDCLWRFLLDDTQEANAIRLDSHASVIDLCAPLAPAEGGELVEGARKGPSAMPSRAPAPVSAPPRSTVAPKPAPPVGGTPTRPPRPTTQDGPLPAIQPLFPQRRKSPLPIVAAFIGGIVVGAVAMFLLGPSREAPQQLAGGDSTSGISNSLGSVEQFTPENSSPPSDPLPSKETNAKPMQNDQAVSNESGDTPKAPPAEEGAAEPVDPLPKPPGEEGKSAPGEGANASAPPPPEKAPPKQDTAPPAPKKPFDDILGRKRRLPLPERNFGLGGAAKKNVELAKLFVDNTENCSLEIIGSDKVLEKGTFSTKPTSGSEKRRSWDVCFHSGSGLAKPGAVATFTLDNQTLSFQWSKADSSARPGSLRHCLLEIRVGDQVQRCILRELLEVEPLTLDLNTVSAASEIPLAEKDVPNKDLLWLDLKLEGFPGHKVENPAGLKVRADEEKDVCTIDFHDGENNDPKKSFIKVQIGFIYKDTDPELRFILQPLVFMKLLVWQGQAAPIRREFQITDEFKAELLKRIADSEIAKYSQMEMEQKKRVNEAKRLLDSAPDKQRDAAQQQYNWVSKKLKEFENWITTAKTNRERWQKKTELFENIKNEGRVQFRVYAKMADEEIEIMRSSGFNK